MTLGSEVLWDVVFSSEAAGKDTDGPQEGCGEGEEIHQCDLQTENARPSSQLSAIIYDGRQLTELVPTRVCSVLSCGRNGDRWTHIGGDIQQKLSPPQVMRSMGSP